MDFNPTVYLVITRPSEEFVSEVYEKLTESVYISLPLIFPMGERFITALQPN